MPVAAAKTLAPDPGPLDASTGSKDVDKVLAGAQARQKDYEKQQQAGLKEISDIRGQELEALHRTEDERKSLVRPEPKFVPQPVAQSTNPIRVWGSAAMILAGLGSLRTRQPLLTAMNAAAKAMQAFQEGDQATANAAFESWKIASANAKEMAEYENKVYEDILSDIGHREDLTTREADKEVKDAEARLTALAHDNRDQIMLDTLRVHGIEGVAQLVTARAKANATIDAQRPKIDEGVALHDAVKAYKAGPEWAPKPGETPAQTASRHAEAIHAMREQYAPSHDTTWTPSQQAHMEETIKQHTESSPLGKAYAAAKQNLQVFNEAVANPGVVGQTAIADAFTQVINGGRAIRGFQMKMLTEHSGLWNKVQIAAQQLGRGGPLSPQMIADMKQYAELVFKERAEQYGQAINHEKARAKRMGLDEANVVPDTFDPNDAPQGGSGGGAPAPHPVPKAYAGQPDGTRFRNNGWLWEKRGNQLVPVGREQ